MTQEGREVKRKGAMMERGGKKEEGYRKEEKE